MMVGAIIGVLGYLGVVGAFHFANKRYTGVKTENCLGLDPVLEDKWGE
jgi:hypothetical protein